MINTLQIREYEGLGYYILMMDELVNRCVESISNIKVKTSNVLDLVLRKDDSVQLMKNNNITKSEVIEAAVNVLCKTYDCTKINGTYYFKAKQADVSSDEQVLPDTVRSSSTATESINTENTSITPLLSAMDELINSFSVVIERWFTSHIEIIICLNSVDAMCRKFLKEKQNSALLKKYGLTAEVAHTAIMEAIESQFEVIEKKSTRYLKPHISSVCHYAYNQLVEMFALYLKNWFISHPKIEDLDILSAEGMCRTFLKLPEAIRLLLKSGKLVVEAVPEIVNTVTNRYYEVVRNGKFLKPKEIDIIKVDDTNSVSIQNNTSFSQLVELFAEHLKNWFIDNPTHEDIPIISVLILCRSFLKSYQGNNGKLSKFVFKIVQRVTNKYYEVVKDGKFLKPRNNVYVDIVSKRSLPVMTSPESTDALQQLVELFAAYLKNWFIQHATNNITISNIQTLCMKFLNSPQTEQLLRTYGKSALDSIPDIVGCVGTKFYNLRIQGKCLEPNKELFDEIERERKLVVTPPVINNNSLNKFIKQFCCYVDTWLYKHGLSTLNDNEIRKRISRFLRIEEHKTLLADSGLDKNIAIRNIVRSVRAKYEENPVHLSPTKRYLENASEKENKKQKVSNTTSITNNENVNSECNTIDGGCDSAKVQHDYNINSITIKQELNISDDDSSSYSSLNISDEESDD